MYVCAGIKNRISGAVEELSHGSVFVGVLFQHRCKTKEVKVVYMCVFVCVCVCVCVRTCIATCTKFVKIFLTKIFTILFILPTHGYV